MKIKLGIKAFSIVTSMVLSLVVIAGCNEETPAPSTPAPGMGPAPKGDSKPAPAPATPAPKEEKPKM